MTLDDIKQSELSLGEREVLDRDRERWKRIGAGAHLDEWLEFYGGLAIRRRLAMRMAHSNQPIGRRYSEAMNALYRADGFDPDDKSTMTALTAVLWLGDDHERMTMLREMRDAMTLGERSRLNSPISARQRVAKALAARTGGTEEKMKESPVAMMKQTIAKLEHELADARAKLARDDSSKFDLGRDTAKDIGKTIAANVGASKAREIAKAITTALNKPKPAG